MAVAVASYLVTTCCLKSIRTISVCWLSSSVDVIVVENNCLSVFTLLARNDAWKNLFLRSNLILSQWHTRFHKLIAVSGENRQMCPPRLLFSPAIWILIATMSDRNLRHMPYQTLAIKWLACIFSLKIANKSLATRADEFPTIAATFCGPGKTLWSHFLILNLVSPNIRQYN